MKKKRRSPKEILENDAISKQEQIYVKLPGQELIPMGINRREKSVDYEAKEIEEILDKFGRKKYSNIHTHPGDFFPSQEDIETFLKDNKMKAMIISPMIGKMKNKSAGYFILRKSKKTPQWKKKKHSTERVLPYSAPETEGEILESAYQTENPHQIDKALKGLARKYHLNYRLSVPKSLSFSPQWDFLKSSKLETKVASIIGISGIALALVFLSPNLTGNAIANLTTKTSSLIGAGLFIMGIVGSYFWFKKK